MRFALSELATRAKVMKDRQAQGSMLELSLTFLAYGAQRSVIQAMARKPASLRASTSGLCRRPPQRSPEIAEAVALVKRYFEGKETDFSDCKLDLNGQDPFFRRIYAAVRRVTWGARLPRLPIAAKPQRLPPLLGRDYDGHSRGRSGADGAMDQGG